MQETIVSGIFSNIWSVILIVVFFGGSIFVHELGHYLAARWRGLVIKRFSIGFGPRVFTWVRGGVEYCVSLLPLGGYVALPQLGHIEAIEGKNEEGEVLPKISYVDKVIVCVMGAVFNVVFAFLIGVVLWMVGQPVAAENSTTVVGYVPKVLYLSELEEVEGPGYKGGLRAGDKIKAVDGVEVKRFTDVKQGIVTGIGRNEKGEAVCKLRIERDGEEKELEVKPILKEVNSYSGDKMRIIGIQPMERLVVHNIAKNSPAAEAGFWKGDHIVEANGIGVYSLMGLRDVLDGSEGGVEVKVIREGKVLMMGVLPRKISYRKPLLEIRAEGHKLELVTECESKDIELWDKEETVGRLILVSVSEEWVEMYGIKEGSVLEKINGMRVGSIREAERGLRGVRNGMVKMEFERVDGSEGTVAVEGEKVDCKVIEAKRQGLIGIDFSQEPEIVYMTPWEQIRDAVLMTVRTLKSLFNSGSDIGVSNLMGPPGILRVLYHFSLQDLRLLMWFVFVMNVNLAVLNLLPIPVLDGGHILFATVERVRGKALNAKVVGGIQGVFFILLFGMMLYVSFFDVRRWQGDSALETKWKVQQKMYIPLTKDRF